MKKENTKDGFPFGEMTGAFAAKLFRHETIFNFHMNNFGAIVRKTKMALTTILLVKKRLLLLKLLKVQ